MTKNEIWNSVNDLSIASFCEISTLGNFRYNINGSPTLVEPYISTNGYSYNLVVFDDFHSNHLVRTDKLVALTFIPIPDELISGELEILHLNGDKTDNSVDNLQWVEDVEIWKPVELPPIVKNRYFISSWGRIKHDNIGPLHGTYCCGYKQSFFRIEDGTRKTYPIHRIVANAFLGLTPELIVNHIDGFTDNNRIDNLEVVTYSQNNQHARLTNLSKSVMNPFLLKLVKDVLIRNDWHPHETTVELHKMGYNEISISMVQNAKKFFIESGENVTILHYKKLYDDVLELTRELLIKYNGDRNPVLKALHEMGYTDITVANISTVKESMKEFNFPNMKLNRKIKEDEREILKKILKKCDMSPSKAIKEVHRLGLNHVTVYDMKYLKRKMLNEMRDDGD